MPLIGQITFSLIFKTLYPRYYTFNLFDLNIQVEMNSSYHFTHFPLGDCEGLCDIIDDPPSYLSHVKTIVLMWGRDGFPNTLWECTLA